MAEKQLASSAHLWLNHFHDFRKIARELREFKVYETIDDLIYRFFHCEKPDRNPETVEDVYREGIRITFIGESSIFKKRDFIKDAFPEAAPLQVENFPGAVSGIESYYYIEKTEGIRFVFMNTPSFSEWSDFNKITDIGEWQTEVIVFVISGTSLNETEKSCLNKLKYHVDRDCLFFVHAAEDTTPLSDIYYKFNLSIISDTLTVNKEEIRSHYFSSSESSSIVQHFAEKKWHDLLFQKIRSYMIQYYLQFETKVEGYSRLFAEHQRFLWDTNKIEDETTQAVDRIKNRYLRKIDQAFPIDASYSPDIHNELNQIAEQLFEANQLFGDRIKPEDLSGKLESATKKLLEEWAIKLEYIIAGYLRDISYEVSVRIDEFGHSYRSSIPLKGKIELQTIRNFSVYLIKTNRTAQFIRIAASGILPAYFIGSALGPLIGGFMGSGPIGWGLIIGGIIAVAIMWAGFKERRKQKTLEETNVAKESMKPFNYYVAQAIRMEFEELLYFSQDALQNIFKEIRKAERKRVTRNNFYPRIKAIDEDSLLKKIRENRESIESVKI